MLAKNKQRLVTRAVVVPCTIAIAFLAITGFRRNPVACSGMALDTNLPYIGQVYGKPDSVNCPSTPNAVYYKHWTHYDAAGGGDYYHVDYNTFQYCTNKQTDPESFLEPECD